MSRFPLVNNLNEKSNILRTFLCEFYKHRVSVITIIKNVLTRMRMKVMIFVNLSFLQFCTRKAIPFQNNSLMRQRAIHISFNKI